MLRRTLLSLPFLASLGFLKGVTQPKVKWVRYLGNYKGNTSQLWYKIKTTPTITEYGEFYRVLETKIVDTTGVVIFETTYLVDYPCEVYTKSENLEWISDVTKLNEVLELEGSILN